MLIHTHTTIHIPTLCYTTEFKCRGKASEKNREIRGRTLQKTEILALGGAGLYLWLFTQKVQKLFFVFNCTQVEDRVWDENEGLTRQEQDNKREITTHVSIHVLHLDGLRELYRHFLRLPDGAIVEVCLVLELLHELNVANIELFYFAKQADW